jgi:hexokinase
MFLILSNKEFKDVKIQVVALVNDTVGTLMACSSLYRDCKAGVILGTGE